MIPASEVSPNGFKVNVAIFMRNDISHTPDGAPGDTGM